MIDSLLEEARETWQNLAFNKVFELPQVVHGHHGKRGFFEDYAVGRLYIDLRLVVKPRLGTRRGFKRKERVYLVAVFERRRHDDDAITIRPFTDQCIAQDRDDRRNVLVDVVQCADSCEGMVYGRSSVVRLQAFQYDGGSRRDVLEERAKATEVSCIVAKKDWELTAHLRERRRVFEQDQLPVQMIKSGAYVVDEISDDQAESNWRLVDDSEYTDAEIESWQEIGTKWHWWLGLDSMRLESQKLPEFEIERGKVFLRPTEFGADAIQPVHEVDLGYDRA